MFPVFLPSNYESLIPPYKIEDLDHLAVKGDFPSLNGMIPALIYAALFGVARIVLTFLVFKPLALYAMKLSPNFKPQKKVEEILKVKKIKDTTFTPADVKSICESAQLSEKDVNEYLWSRRRNTAINKKVTKFVEALWRFVFYAFFNYLGIKALFFPSTASWVLDTKQHWMGWPLQPQVDGIIFYYQIELGSYIHQAMWTEVTRSDAAEMLLHHFTTILLILMSYLTNFTRIGSSILLVHDLADIFLESGKCFVYISKAKGNKWITVVCDSLFAIFALSFFVTRLVIYPRFLVYSLVYEAPAIMGMWPGYWAFAGLLIVLQCLHIFWFYLICRMIYRLLTTGIEKDERSDDDEPEEEYTKKE